MRARTGRPERGSEIRYVATASKVLFWLVAGATLGWIILYAAGSGYAAELAGEEGARLATTVLLALLAISSGVLVLYHRRVSPYSGDRDRYWSGAEVFYALVLFGSLFFGIYSFFGWYYA